MLIKRAPTIEQREINNKNNKISVIFFVISVFVLYLYSFSNMWEVFNIPSPVHVFKEVLGFDVQNVYDDDGNFDSNLYINEGVLDSNQNLKYSNDTERLIFFSLICLSFLTTYFLPVKHKKLSLFIFASAIVTIIFNLKVILGVIFMHLLVFSFLHIKSAKSSYVSLLIGFVFPLIFLNLSNIVNIFLYFSISICVSYFLFEKLIYPILDKNNKLSYFLRMILLQSPIIACFIIPYINSFTHNYLKLSFGIILFFWQWERITMYQIDYNDGAIPEDITLINYLSMFINPSIISTWNFGGSISQGYTYTETNFLAKDKNILAIEGAKLSLIALFYLIFGAYLMETLSYYINYFFGIISYTDVYTLVFKYSECQQITTATVLLSTFIGQVKWFMFFGGLVHLRVGLWKIYGYNIEPYFNKPWLATNLANFWVRYTYHYREFLFRVFYYPFFSRFFKKNKTLRVFMATFFTLTVGNFLWGHLTEEMFSKGFYLYNFKLIYTLPYFLLLGLGISLTQIYLLKTKKNNKRKPWTLDKMFLMDILCSYLTFQFYSLIHIFARPIPNGNFVMYAKLFLIGLGIHLPR